MLESKEMNMRLAPLALIATIGLAAAARPAVGAVAIGEKLQPFKLADVTGKTVDLAGLQGRKAVVLMFIATQCPVSNAYNERMAALSREYGARGVAFVGINSNRQESVEEIAGHAAQHGFAFPILKDVGNVQADHFGAQVTPEIYMYDPGWVLRYHGRIDDDRSGANVKSQDLRHAIDAVLAGRAVPVAETKAFGCTIKRVAP
ncbi:MAG TPA: thioredoxin family protein [Vicinamibacteria bacterium]